MTATPRKPRSSRSGRATMADVAAAAGVSAMTVSRALRRPDTVSEEVRARVEEASRRLGFVPSRVASALASARTMTVAVLIPSLTNAVFIDLLAGVQETLTPQGYQPLVGITGYGPEAEERVLRTQLAHDPDGVILSGLHHTPGTWDLLRSLTIPVVHTMDLSVEGDLMAEGAQDDCPVQTVGFSQFDAGYAVGAHLAARGRRRIGLIAGQLDPRTRQRCDGWRQALRDAGRHDPALELMVPDATSVALGAELLERALATHPDTDALFLCNDDLAQGALFQCARLGIPVPERLAIAGFNDLAGAAWTVPPLTTVATPRRAIGVEAARLLIAGMENRTPQSRENPRRVDLGFRLMVRETT
ncbi:LacI family gluconate utilization system Gnt-I transcriptional repressor [Azospirillum sp. OGB3]|uniref:LacI family DNA-binding transcriptional regulator n=1 Tax=Azospirillum sp. OGB3 TaxID=2587012 RepID=UPI0017E1BE82|nr:LacI family DNA-binding transcriptional regulator [Azospirillum sp. OGB3]MBB3263944.1 LacI family gluconate utilization system Gnt-I transcriptional repressor [Azospirillum sp. OGB3]